MDCKMEYLIYKKQFLKSKIHRIEFLIKRSKKWIAKKNLNKDWIQILMSMYRILMKKTNFFLTKMKKIWQISALLNQLHQK